MWCGLKWPDMALHELASSDAKATDDTRYDFQGSVVGAKVVLSATIFPVRCNHSQAIRQVLRACSTEDIARRYSHKQRGYSSSYGVVLKHVSKSGLKRKNEKFVKQHRNKTSKSYFITRKWPKYWTKEFPCHWNQQIKISAAWNDETA